MAKEIKRTKIGGKIREYRKNLHLTQEEVAARLEIKRNTYARYETDTIPPINILAKLGSFFGITTDELLGTEGYYNSAVNNLQNQFVNLSSVDNYSYSNSFSTEELKTLLKITYMSKEKREELLKYIESVVEEENL